MENLIVKNENNLQQELHYPLSPALIRAKKINQSQATNTDEETNTLTMILITLAMIVLTVAVIAKVITMFAIGLMGLVKTQLNWLHFQH